MKRSRRVHGQQTPWLMAGVSERVDRTIGNADEVTALGDARLGSNTKLEGAVEDIEGLVISLMAIRWWASARPDKCFDQAVTCVREMVIGVDGQAVGNIDGGREPARVEMIDRREVFHRRSIQRFARLFQRGQDQCVDVSFAPMLCGCIFGWHVCSPDELSSG